jgi:hypothetical protein
MITPSFLTTYVVGQTDMGSKRAPTWISLVLGAVALLALPSATLVAQDTAHERARVLAVADSALLAITQGNMAMLTDLMLPEAVLFPTVTRNDTVRYALRTRAEQRASTGYAGVVERGWDGEVRINGPVAMVWLPYDLYRSGVWSHCGVDVFTLIKRNGAWRIASLVWSSEQPPVCAKHPDGPPIGA